MSTQQLQSSTYPPAQPTYILRGHTAQIHAVHFFRQNLRLLTGDADGWVVCWSLPIKRPVAVWRAHGSGTVLGVGSWGEGRVVTHGRDGKLHIWQLREEDQADLSKILPIDDAVTERKQPWLLHTLVVNAINFCSFASVLPPSASGGDNDGLLIATPGVKDGSITITSFPTEDRAATIPAPKGTNTGMLMAIGLYYASDNDGKSQLTAVGGYESGHATLFRQNASGHWECFYVHKAHSQPVLSLAILAPSPSRDKDTAIIQGCFFTSSADAIIARHPLPTPSNLRPSPWETEDLQTRHAGQQSIALRADNLIFATAGWDGRVRVYSARTMKELAVLKWHKEGCYAVAFAEVTAAAEHREGTNGDNVGGDGEVVKRQLTVAEQRVEKTKSTHWLAAGSKDGKVSLWEVY